MAAKIDAKVKKALTELGVGEEALVSDVEDEALIDALQKRGFRVDKPVPAERRIKLAGLKTKKMRLGIVSDTHLGSKFQQLTHLHDIFRIFEEEGVEAILHGGDLVHGSSKMHVGMEYEIFTHGADAQVEYAVDNIPAPHCPAYIITGNHDISFWKDSGTNVVKSFCGKRPDWTYLGSEGAHLEIGGAKLYLWHGGSAAYAKSYNSQKWAEAVSPENKPHIMLNGHLHFISYVHHRNIDCFQLPCLQSQTPFEKKKRLTPDIGALMLDIWVSNHGLEDLQTRWLLRRRPLEDDY